MAEGGQNSSFLRVLVQTGIDCWPKFTNLIVDIKNKDEEFTWRKSYQTSKSHVHAEIQMLNDKEFNDEVEKGKADETPTDKTEKAVDIILTLNYSPCGMCADKLKEFYKGKESLIRNFTIRFSRLYRINEQPNIDGLKDLSRAGITLEAMTEESWFDVLMTDESWFDSIKNAKYSFEEIIKAKDWFDKVMELFDLDPDGVKKRDAATSERLEELLVKEELVEKMKKL